MTKAEFKDLWKQIVELVEDQDFCDEDRDNDERDDELLCLINSVLDEDLNKDETKVKEFLTEFHWGTSEFYNSEYACEAPGSRSSHRSGYKESMKKSKVLLEGILGPV